MWFTAPISYDTSTVRNPEAVLTRLLFAFGFLVIGVTSVFTFTAANTLFLKIHSAADLAYCYLGFAAVTPLVGLLYFRLQARVGLGVLVTLALAFDIVTLVAF